MKTHQVLLLAGICFGEVHYLHEPLMYYRQHDKNVTGNAPGSIQKKVLQMWQNRRVPLVSRLHWEGLNAFVTRFHRDLSTENKQLIEVFLHMRQQSFIARLREIVKHRFQLFDSTVLLIIKLCIRRYI